MSSRGTHVLVRWRSNNGWRPHECSLIERDSFGARVFKKLDGVSMGDDAARSFPNSRRVRPSIYSGNVFARYLGGPFKANEVEDGFSRIHVHGRHICENRDDSSSQFANIAIESVAKIANNSIMKDLDLENRKWLASKLNESRRGTKGAVAQAIGKKPDVIARIINFSGRGETRNLTLPELHALARFFNETPPGLIGAKQVPLERRSQDLTEVPLLERVPGGKLKQPFSQLPIEDIPTLTFSGLGKGTFFALTVEGDSMDRIAPDGAVIVVDESDTLLVTGKPYVFWGRTGTSFKIWKPNPPRWSPASTNPIHEPIFVKSKETAERMVVGRVRRAVIDLS